MREKARKYRVWIEASRSLENAKAALSDEESRWSGRRQDLENEISGLGRLETSIRNREKEVINRAQAAIDKANADTEAARTLLDTELAGFHATEEGLKSVILAAEGVDKRVTAEL